MTQPTTTTEAHEITCKAQLFLPMRHPFEAHCTCGWRAFARTKEQLEAICELHLQLEVECGEPEQRP